METAKTKKTKFDLLWEDLTTRYPMPELHLHEDLRFVGAAYEHLPYLPLKWRSRNDFKGRFDAEMSAVAEQWDRLIKRYKGPNVGLEVYVDVGDRKAITKNTFVARDGTPLQLRVLEVGGERLDEQRESDLLIPLWRHCQPVPAVGLGKAFQSRSSELAPLLQFQDAALAEPVASRLRKQLIAKLDPVEEMIFKLLDDIRVIQARLANKTLNCGCDECCRRRAG